MANLRPAAWLAIEVGGPGLCCDAIRFRSGSWKTKCRPRPNANGSSKTLVIDSDNGISNTGCVYKLWATPHVSVVATLDFSLMALME
jgi:hypothetical protein